MVEYNDRQVVGGAAAGGRASDSVCVVHTVARTFALLLTHQITGLFHHGQFNTFKSGKSSNPFSGTGALYHSNPPCG